MQNSIELLHVAREQALFQNLVGQLNKDFGMANITTQFNWPITPEELAVQVYEKLYVIILEKFNVYLNLMYVVDVPEKSFKNIDGGDVVEVARQVTFLLLDREFQKVKLKFKYSS